MKLSIAPNGSITTIYSPEVAKILMAVGDISLRRASHVEPGADLKDAAKAVLKYQGKWPDDAEIKWYADMSPTTPDLVFGPYDTREEAIAAEVAYLDSNLHKITHDRTS